MAIREALVVNGIECQLVSQSYSVSISFELGQQREPSLGCAKLESTLNSPEFYKEVMNQYTKNLSLVISSFLMQPEAIELMHEDIKVHQTLSLGLFNILSYETNYIENLVNLDKQLEIAIEKVHMPTFQSLGFSKS